MALIKVRDLAWARMRAPDLDAMEEFLTHFGLTMLRARPWELAETLSRETGIRVLAARDRWRLDLDAELGA